MKTVISIAAAAAALALPIASAQQNPAARRGPADFSMLVGGWNGANLETRSACSKPQNEGFHGTYADYQISHDPSAALINVNETTTSGIFCNYAGTYAGGPLRPKWTGTMSCSDGKHGAFDSSGFLITPTEMQIRLNIKLDGSETCSVDSILGGSRF
jgi:hypothetical protein